MREGVSVKEFGVIKEIKKFVIKIEGLSNCMVGQLVNFTDDTKGFVIGFNEKEVLVLLLGSGGKIKANDIVYSEWQTFTIPVGDNFLRRIVNSLCQPLDGKSPVKEEAFYNIFRDAPSVLDRVPIDEMLQTGIRIIDSSIPIGKGQRELIIGDRMTGKTSIAVDTILNQKDKDVICIYCCIGRDYASFEKVVGVLAENGALDYTIVVSSLASSSIGEQYLAPYTAATLGEYFMYSGRDVFVVFDDLTKHAWAYREISLLLERPPGREAYPGDIFYLHAQLMERAGRLSPELRSGSMTFFPIADTLQGDIAGFIPTNLISMTDGQVYLNSTLFGEGFKPAIDLGLSVSRIGNKVQSEAMRELTKDVGLNYIQHRELLKATKLRAAVSEELNLRLRHGEKIEQLLKQDRFSPSPIAEQLILFYALKKGALDAIPDAKCEDFKKGIYAFAQENFPDLVKSLEEGKTMTADDRKRLNECIVQFFKE
ncbi:MAG: F0F1 ATP synthase subunit alpha [Candidatus Omnitrophica bacterium]|nr:F0F1 ATP synthase subunit alpha [Candidatus Omnitrophota bacterium]